MLGAPAPLPVIAAPRAAAGRPRVVGADAGRRRDCSGSGRAAERAEAIARTCARDRPARRQTTRRSSRSTAGAGRGGWRTRCASVRRVATAASTTEAMPSGGRSSVLDAELAAATRAVVERLRAFVAEAATVGEYLSVERPAGCSATIVRVARRVRRRLRADRRASTTCSPTSRRSSGCGTSRRCAGRRGGSATSAAASSGRSSCSGSSTRACADADGRRRPIPADRRCAESSTVGARGRCSRANESLVAYRRHHRSDVELAPTLDAAAARRRQPTVVRWRASTGSPSTSPTSSGRQGRQVERARRPAALDGATTTPVESGHSDRARRSTRSPPRRRHVVRHARASRSLVPAGAMSDRQRTGVTAVASYRVSHRTTYEYSQPMTDGYTLAYLLPRPTPQQDRRARRGGGDAGRPTSAPSTSTCSATACCRSACTTSTRRCTLHGRERGRGRADAAATATDSRGRSSPRPSVSCAAATRCRCGRSPAGSPVVPPEPDVAALRRLVEAAFRPDRPIVDGGAGVLPHASTRRSSTTRRSPTCRRHCRPCSRPAGACARTSPTSPPAACDRSGSPRAT